MTATAEAKKRIMIVDDHPLIRQGIATLIRTEPDLDVCATVGNADEALLALASDMPDLLLLDLSLPGTHGIDLLKILRTRYPELRVLVFSMHEESVYAERSLRAGARGYIMKLELGEKVLDAIRCVLEGKKYVSPALASRLGDESAENPAHNNRLSELDQLSNRELQVYAWIGKGMTTRMIAEKLQLSIKTVHVYREHIKRKLGYRNAPELVHHATLWVKSEARKPSPVQ